MIYATFNSFGNAEYTSNFEFDHAIEVPDMDETAHANELYYNGEKVVNRELITMSVPEGIHMVGQAVPVEGLPEDAVLLANGQPARNPYKPQTAGRVVLDVVGAYRASWPLTLEVHDQESLWKMLREKRNQMLSATDWTVLPHSPLSEEKVQEYVKYRQALRDLPVEQAGATMENISWPDLPE